MRYILLVGFLVFLVSCGYTPQATDIETVTRFIKEKNLTDTEVCLTDKTFHFPDIIVGTKYSGEGLSQLDALVSAGLLSETEEIIGTPKSGPKYVYHYKEHRLIERKTFYLTNQGVKFFRTGKNNGHFCYGNPENVQIDEVTSFKNDQGDLILTATVSYDVMLKPDATWVSNAWVKREFPQASWGVTRSIVQQQFIKDSKGSINPVLPGILDNRYW